MRLIWGFVAGEDTTKRKRADGPALQDSYSLGSEYSQLSGVEPPPYHEQRARIKNR